MSDITNTDDTARRMEALVAELIEAAEDRAFKGTMHPDTWDDIDARFETAKAGVLVALVGMHKAVLEIATHGHRGGYRSDPQAIARDVLRTLDQFAG